MPMCPLPFNILVNETFNSLLRSSLVLNSFYYIRTNVGMMGTFQLSWDVQAVSWSRYIF